MVCGILLVYLGSYLFVDTVGGWRIMYGASAVPALVLLSGMVSVPSTILPLQPALFPSEFSFVHHHLLRRQFVTFVLLFGMLRIPFTSLSLGSLGPSGFPSVCETCA